MYIVDEAVVGVGFCVVTLTVVTLHAMRSDQSLSFLCSVSYDTFCSRALPVFSPSSSPHREPDTDAAAPVFLRCDQDHSRSRTRSRARLCETLRDCGTGDARALARLTTQDDCILAIPGPSMGLLGRLVMGRPERNANQPWPDPSSAACAGTVDQCVASEW